MLAACGGGGGDDNGNGGSGGSDDNGGATGSGQVASKADKKVAGNFVLSEVRLGPDSAATLSYDQYTNKTPGIDGNPGYGSYYPNDQIVGVNSPVATVGYRLDYAAPATPVATTSVGRVAFELKDQATGASQEVLQILVDKVNVSVAATGGVTFAVPQDAKMYLYAKNSNAKSTTVEIKAPSAVVKEVTIADDTNTNLVVLDVDAAVTAAIQATTDATKRAVLTSVKNFSADPAAPFATSLSFSNLNIVTGAANTPLVVKDIKVTGFNNVPGILNGGGIGGDKPGYIQVAAQ
jgi:hypothetical protein